MRLCPKVHGKVQLKDMFILAQKIVNSYPIYVNQTLKNSIKILALSNFQAHGTLLLTIVTIL